MACRFLFRATRDPVLWEPHMKLIRNDRDKAIVAYKALADGELFSEFSNSSNYSYEENDQF